MRQVASISFSSIPLNERSTFFENNTSALATCCTPCAKSEDATAVYAAAPSLPTV